MASTYVAGGDLEYGRYANPTWAAFEEALGALEGGRALAFSSGLAAVSTVLDLVGQDALVVAPRHAYLGSVGQLGDLEARGRHQGAARRHRRHRRGDRRAATTRPSSGSSRRPTPPSRSPTSSASSRRATRPAPGRRRQHLRHAPAAAAARARRRHRAALGDQVPRRPQRRGDGRARRPRRRSCTTSSRAAATWSARSPGRWRPGWPCAACAPCTCGSSASQANAAELRPAPRVAPRRRRRCATRASARSSRPCSPTARGRRPAHPLHLAVGARHLARQRRVDVRAPPPLEERGRHHPRGPGADVRRHRGRRRPLGRPRAGPRPDRWLRRDEVPSRNQRDEVSRPPPWSRDGR